MGALVNSEGEDPWKHQILTIQQKMGLADLLTVALSYEGFRWGQGMTALR